VDLQPHRNCRVDYRRKGANVNIGGDTQPGRIILKHNTMLYEAMVKLDKD